MAIIKTHNAQGGSDARYNVAAMTPEERRNFDSDGRPLGADAPNQWTWTQGLPGAREMNAEGGGGGGGGVAGVAGSSAYGQYRAQAKLAYDNAMARIKAERASTRADYGFNAEGTQLDGMNLLGKFQQMFRTSAGVLDRAREGALMRGLGRKGLGARVALEPKYDLDVASKDLSSSYQGILSRLAGQESEAENTYQQALLQAMMMEAAYMASLGGYGGGDDGGSSDDYAARGGGSATGIPLNAWDAARREDDSILHGAWGGRSLGPAPRPARKPKPTPIRYSSGRRGGV